MTTQNGILDALAIADCGGHVVYGNQRPSMSQLYAALATYNQATAPALTVLGMGSSVGVGASLPNPATQAPSAYFASALKATVDPLGIVNMPIVNSSVNGSVFNDGAQNITSYLTSNPTTKVVVFAYGMNDGQTASFNAGQTFPAVSRLTRDLARTCQAFGAVPVFLTSPHPRVATAPLNSFSMPNGIAQIYPTSVAANVPDNSLVPSVANSTPTITPPGMTTPIKVSARHLRVNEAMRAGALAAGAVLIDVEPYWFRAVAALGEGALFDSTEFVHPNLVGHQMSYWAAIDAFMLGLSRGEGQAGAAAGIPPGWDSVTTGSLYNVPATATTLFTPTRPGMLVLQARHGGVALDNFTTALVAFDRTTNLASAITSTIAGTTMAPLTLSAGAIRVTPAYAGMNFNWQYFALQPVS